MNELNFCFWLHGADEICGLVPNETQWEMIKEHLELARSPKFNADTVVVNKGAKVEILKHC